MGKSSSASWVDFMMSPLGLRMKIGFRVGRLFITGASIVPKWAVLPVSATASWWGIVNVGGPTALDASNVDAQLQVGSNDELITLSTLDAAVGFPLSQLREWLRGTNSIRLPSEPGFLAVASSLWPGFLLRHVALVWFLLYPNPHDQQ
jgi:hypothetical protein